MANLSISGNNPREEKQRTEILKKINDKLTIKELERLGKIADSSKAKEYLNGKFFALKTFLKL